MKSVSILIAALLLFVSSRPAAADSDTSLENGLGSPASVAADALVVRPLCFVVLIAGTGLFVATLPIAVISRSTNKSASALVAGPAKQTFVRKLGDLSALEY